MTNVFITLNRKKAQLVTLSIFLITSFFVWHIRHLSFDYDFDMFFPKGDPDFQYYQDFVEEFGTDNDYLFIAIPTIELLSASYLTQLDELTKHLQGLPGITDVQSLTNQSRYQITPLGVNRIKLINPEQEGDSVLFKNENLMGLFIARNRGSTSMILRHASFKLKSEADEFYKNLESEIGGFFDDFLISGKVEAQYHFVNKLEKELSTLLTLSLALVSIALFLIFKTLRGIILPFCVLIVSTIWCVGMIAVLGKSLDVMMVMVPPILLVVAMSDVIHFCAKYNELVHQGESVKKAISLTWKSVGKATLLTSISTAIGFATLSISPIPPIRNFGIFTAVGVMIAYVVTFTLLPAMLTFLGKAISRSPKSEVKWSGLMHQLYLTVIKRRRKILWLGTLIILVLSLGVMLLRQNTFIIVGIKKSDPLMKKVLFFDEQYDGSNTSEMILDLKGADLFDEPVLQSLDSLSHFLERDLGFTHILSPLKAIKEINSSLHAGNLSYYRIPRAGSEIKQVKRVYNRRAFNEVRSQFQTSDSNKIRISMRQRDIGSYEARKRQQAIEDYFKEAIGQRIDYRQTGTSFLVNKTDKHVAKNLITGLGLGLVIIAMLLSAIFKNPRYVALSLIPNLIPLLCLFGLLGYFHVDLNISTTLIFGIAFGIAVDDSIHFLTRFQQESSLGKTPLYALKRTFISTGKSIVLTTVVLCVGFSLFAFSGFSATFYTGVFMSIALIIALLADLLILPILLFPAKKG